MSIRIYIYIYIYTYIYIYIYIYETVAVLSVVSVVVLGLLPSLNFLRALANTR